MTHLNRAGGSGWRHSLTILGAVFTFVLTGHSQDIQWITDYYDGMSLAREKNRPVLVDFWSRWCIPCRQADKEVHTDPRFLEAASKFVCIRVDVDDARDVPQRFGVRSMPAKRFLDPRGTVLVRVDKYASASDLVAAMKPLSLDFEALADTFAELEGDPGNVEALRKLGRFYAKEGLSAPAEEYFALADKPPLPPSDAAPPDTTPADPILQTLPAPIPTKLIPGWTPASGALRETITHSPALPLVRLADNVLLGRYPEELAGIKMAPGTAALGPLLKKLGDSVARFMADLPNTASTELIRQERLRPDGKIDAKIEQEVQYLLFPRSGLAGQQMWREERTDRKGKDAKLRRMRGQSFLSSGFATSCALFMPEFQKDMAFRYLGTQSSEPHSHVIVFSQVAAHPAITAKVILDGQEAFCAIQGIVWVDPESYQVVKMMTDFPEPIPRTYLSRMLSEISYREVQFGSSTKTFWMPSEVVITTLYRGITYRNIHRYSDYKLFTVESYEERKPVLLPTTVK